MDFHKKLQELRKSKGITQEELAEVLHVSRTAISKWESGRGYPSIDSLKELSRYFSVTIDDLLSSEKVLLIAEFENRSNIRRVKELLFGVVDICSFLLILLPLYPNTVDGFVYSVNLLAYTEISGVHRMIYWIFYIALIVAGSVRILMLKKRANKVERMLTIFSLVLSVLLVIFLAMSREVYAIIMAFVLLVIKGLIGSCVECLKKD